MNDTRFVLLCKRYISSFCCRLHCTSFFSLFPLPHQGDIMMISFRWRVLYEFSMQTTSFFYTIHAKLTPISPFSPSFPLLTFLHTSLPLRKTPFASYLTNSSQVSFTYHRSSSPIQPWIHSPPCEGLLPPKKIFKINLFAMMNLTRNKKTSICPSTI